MGPRGYIRCLLVLGVVALITLQSVSLCPALSHDTALAGVPNYEWKFLSAQERAAVEKSIEVIRNQRFKNVTLNIIDDADVSYTGPIRISQDSTQFDYSIGWEQSWSDYVAMTPSRTYHIWAPWNLVEPTKGTFNFSSPDRDYDNAVHNGMSVFHLRLFGPIMRDPGAGCCNILPDWDKTLNHTSLLNALQKYVTVLVTHFKGRVQQYEIWDEANVYYGNGNLPIQQIIDIIKTEALTIRSIDPNAQICIDLDNATPYSVQWQNRWGRSNWTTEDFVQKLMAAEVPFDIIGLETHYGDGTAPREGGVDTLYHRLIELGKFGKPIYIWEDGMVSYIDPKYQSQMSGDFWVGPWHGSPSEEKQAEFMVAETLVYLGNPSVLGIRWLMLVDVPSVPAFWNQYDGVVHIDGTRKPSFYALEALWGSLKVNMTLHSDNGVALFRGLAGNYTALTEGYEPATIQVAEGKQNSLLLALKRTPEYRHAAELLAVVESRLNDAENASFQSLIARSELGTARTEYEIGAQALSSHNYDKALNHVRKALGLVEYAFATERAYQEQRLALERQQQEQQRQQQEQERQQQLTVLGILTTAAVVVIFIGIVISPRRGRHLPSKGERCRGRVGGSERGLFAPRCT